MFISAIFARALAIVAVPLLLLTLSEKVAAQASAEVPMSATLLCRPAAGDETANATMVKPAVLLTCRPVAIRMRMSDGTMKTIGSVTAKPETAPDFSKALTPAQVTAAYNNWAQRTFHIDHSP